MSYITPTRGKGVGRPEELLKKKQKKAEGGLMHNSIGVG